MDCAKYGTLDMDEVQTMLMNAKLAHIKSTHPFAFTPPKEIGGRWQTFVMGENGKRKNIRAKSEEELLKKLLPYHSKEQHIDNMTFNNLYLEWIEYKKDFAVDNTIKRHNQHYDKYYKASKLHNMKIREIDELTLDSECNRIVKEYNLSCKEWTNIKTIIKGMFEYACKKHYINHNPISNVKIKVKFKQVNKKTGKTETYNTQERKELFSYLDEMYKKTNDVVFLAIKLNFFMGLRVGELSALKWEDYDGWTSIHVVREEIHNQMHNTYSVVNHTKTNTDRFVSLVPKAIAIIQKLPRDGDYMFMRGGKRLTSRQLNYVLEKYAERKCRKTKSSHKIRKTFASNLNSGGVPLDEIREKLGHTNLKTTLDYIYNPLTEKETYDLMAKAL